MGESLRSDHRHGFDQPDEENGDTTAGAEVDRVRDQIAALLRANRGVEFCGECLGAALGAGQRRRQGRAVTADTVSEVS